MLMIELIDIGHYKMNANVKPSFITLALMISFASVNAVLFTPALPSIAHFFIISQHKAQDLITLFLIGYAAGQLIYGPFANRFGRKPTLYAGIILQILSSITCVVSGMLHEYFILLLSRFLLAVGSGVGLKMAFTLVNEHYTHQIASQKIAYLMLAFAVTPGLGIALGGILNTHFGWESCFYAGAIYGLILLLLVSKIQETKNILDYNAFKLSYLMNAYKTQFKNTNLVAGGLLMGASTAFIYIFAAAAPFIAINLLGMSSADYGIANILPPMGLIIGSLVSARAAKKYSLSAIIKTGIWFVFAGILLMVIIKTIISSAILSLFAPMIFIYFGLSLILPNASAIAMSDTEDKAHGSAVMNFINMGLATAAVLSLGFFSMSTALLPAFYFVLSGAIAGIYFFICR